MRGKPYDKEQMLRTATRQAVGALALLAVALAAVVYLVTSVLYGTAWAVAVSGMVGVLAIATWFLLPLWRRSSGRRP
ncbi:MAG: DUF6328 family protein [Actinomycetota bacterium]|nr:DUF6328 family protein [Actinomycetota bacterium]